MKVLLVGLFVFSEVVFASTSNSDLGVLGRIYPIVEEDLIEYMKAKAASKSVEEIDDFNHSLTNRGMSYVKRPPGISLPRALEYRALAFDPSLRLKHSITDAAGNVLFPAGKTVNPLDVIPMRKTLCFIDGDDFEQVLWVHSYCHDAVRNKVVLVKGNYLEITKKLEKRIYFDQRSNLVGRFAIRALPAVVRASGRQLIIEEFPLHQQPLRSSP